MFAFGVFALLLSLLLLLSGTQAIPFPSSFPALHRQLPSCNNECHQNRFNAFADCGLNRQCSVVTCTLSSGGQGWRCSIQPGDSDTGTSAPPTAYPPSTTGIQNTHHSGTTSHRFTTLPSSATTQPPFTFFPPKTSHPPSTQSSTTLQVSSSTHPATSRPPTTQFTTEQHATTTTSTTLSTQPPTTQPGQCPDICRTGVEAAPECIRLLSICRVAVCVTALGKPGTACVNKQGATTRPPTTFTVAPTVTTVSPNRCPGQCHFGQTALNDCARLTRRCQIVQCTTEKGLSGSACVDKDTVTTRPPTSTPTTTSASTTLGTTAAVTTTLSTPTDCPNVCTEYSEARRDCDVLKSSCAIKFCTIRQDGQLKPGFECGDRQGTTPPATTSSTFTSTSSTSSTQSTSSTTTSVTHSTTTRPPSTTTTITETMTTATTETTTTTMETTTTTTPETTTTTTETTTTTTTTTTTPETTPTTTTTPETTTTTTTITTTPETTTTTTTSTTTTTTTTPETTTTTTTTPVITTTTTAPETTITTMPCVRFDCAKCGSALECYVNTGDLVKDSEICSIVLTRQPVDRFCTLGGTNPRTVCSQTCGNTSILCFTGTSYGLSCPSAATSDPSMRPKCTTGAGSLGNSPADLSNLATYQFCGTNIALTCVGGGKCIGG